MFIFLVRLPTFRIPLSPSLYLFLCLFSTPMQSGVIAKLQHFRDQIERQIITQREKKHRLQIQREFEYFPTKKKMFINERLSTQDSYMWY